MPQAYPGYAPGISWICLGHIFGHIGYAQKYAWGICQIWSKHIQAQDKEKHIGYEKTYPYAQAYINMPGSPQGLTSGPRDRAAAR